MILVPGLHHLMRIHTVRKVERGRNVNVFENTERGTDGNLMTHTVPPVLDKAALEQQILLRIDTVGKVTRIAHGNLLIPALLTHHLLTLEGIEAVH